jgi:hypothetical protein
MVSGHVNNNNPDAYANVMQGKILFNGSQLPKLVWNQIKILIISNKDGKLKKQNNILIRFFLCL